MSARLKELESRMNKAIEDLEFDAESDFHGSIASDDPDDHSLMKAIDFDLDVVEASGEFDTYDFLKAIGETSQMNHGRLAFAVKDLINLTRAQAMIVQAQTESIRSLKETIETKLDGMAKSFGVSSFTSRAAITSSMAKGMVADRKFSDTGDPIFDEEDFDDDDDDDGVKKKSIKKGGNIGQEHKNAVAMELVKYMRDGSVKSDEAMKFASISPDTSINDIMKNFSQPVCNVVSRITGVSYPKA
jgi:hypothetical protein